MGELCVDAYVKAGIVDLDHPYVATLSDTKSRAEARNWSTCWCSPGTIESSEPSPLRPTGQHSPLPVGLERWSLAYSPPPLTSSVRDWAELVEATEQWAIGHGLHTVIIVRRGLQPPSESDVREPRFHSRSAARLGRTQRSPPPNVHKEGRRLGRHLLPRCGGEPFSGDHEPCRDALELEPPRFCTVCKRRMIVQITPHWTARCKEHGIQTS